VQTDKASMLEEAIEYLKSLQFQLQVHIYNLHIHKHACDDDIFSHYSNM